MQQLSSITAPVAYSTDVWGRLPQPVAGQDPLQAMALELEPPSWLTHLQLDNERQGLGCLPWRTRACKRALDIVVAATLLFLSIPIMLLAALAIKLTSRGPIFFTQTRVGLNSRFQLRRKRSTPPGEERRQASNYGRPFTIYKLRTMTVQGSGEGPTVNGDRRVTLVGRFMRQTRIDELPQLLNVLRGEMSMVGPRPECIEYMDELSRKVPGYLQRLRLKPGLTGIAQIEAGYANNLESYCRKVAFDRLYLKHCCVRNDLKIMFRTVRVVLTGFGAL